MKRKIKSSDSYIPTNLTSASSSSYRRKRSRRQSVDYGRRGSTSSGGLTGYSSNGSVYSGNGFERALVGASGATLGFIHQNVPGAALGAAKSVEIYDKLKTKNVYQTNMSSVYRGKFKKPKKYAINSMTKCSMQGYVMDAEYYGTVTDPNSVMLMSSTYSSVLYGQCFCSAAIRKLFKKAGICVTDRDGSLGLFSPYNSDGFKITFQRTNPVTGANISLDYTTVANDTLTTVITNSAFAQYFINYLNSSDVNIPSKMYLYSSDRNVADTNWRLCSQLDLTAETIEYFATADIMVQNQSKAVLEASNSIDRNDTQPLNGVIYQFRNEPRIKSAGNVPAGSGLSELIKFQGAGYTGIRLLRGQDFVNTAFNNPPSVGMFANCIAKSNVGLGSGVMKKNYISHHVKGKVINVLPKLRMEAFGLAPIKINGVPCKSTLLFFQEQMRTSSVNPVVVAYEYHIKVGCLLTTSSPKVAIQNDFGSEVLNL